MDIKELEDKLRNDGVEFKYRFDSNLNVPSHYRAYFFYFIAAPAFEVQIRNNKTDKLVTWFIDPSILDQNGNNDNWLSLYSFLAAGISKNLFLLVEYFSFNPQGIANFDKLTEDYNMLKDILGDNLPLVLDAISTDRLARFRIGAAISPDSPESAIRRLIFDQCSDVAKYAKKHKHAKALMPFL